MFSWDGPLPEPQVRTAEDLVPVLADPGCNRSGPLYFMYRDLAQSPEDAGWLSGQHLRYDVTVIPSTVICGEYVKTKGHYHPENPEGVRYPEIYEVLEGSAEYLLQDIRLHDVVSVHANKGDQVLIPPGYGHVTINPGMGELVMANIVSTSFVSIYEEYEARHGGAYYRMADGTYRENPHYRTIPRLRHLGRCNLAGFPGLGNSPLYDLVGQEEVLWFLNYPEEFRFDHVLAD
jgi:glucose-6-phosphate isomerase, archaeal